MSRKVKAKARPRSLRCADKSCCMCHENHCIALIETFPYGECPFMKTKEQVIAEKAKCHARLIKKDLAFLIDYNTYKKFQKVD